MKSVEDTTSQTDSSNGSANEALAVDTTRRKRKKQDERNPFGPNGGVYFRPRNGKLVPHMFLPRILKSDVRRCYAQMFTNIYNSCDSSLMEKYLRTFYRPDFFFMQSFPDTSGVLKNIDVASRFWAAKMDSSPDLHFDLKAVRMRARSDGTATIHFHFTLKGIFFVPEDLYQYVCHENGIDGTIGSSTVISSEGQCAGMTARALAEQHGLYPLGVLPRQTKASFLLMAEIDTAIFDRACDPDDYKWGACHGPLRPVLYDLDGIASMHLDASNMIHYMDFEGR